MEKERKAVGQREEQVNRQSVGCVTRPETPNGSAVDEGRGEWRLVLGGSGRSRVGKAVCHAVCHGLGFVLKTRGSDRRVVSKGVRCNFCFQSNSTEGWWDTRRVISGLQQSRGGVGRGACSRQWLGCVRKEGWHGTVSSECGCLRPLGCPIARRAHPSRSLMANSIITDLLLVPESPSPLTLPGPVLQKDVTISQPDAHGGAWGICSL